MVWTKRYHLRWLSERAQKYASIPSRSRTTGQDEPVHPKPTQKGWRKMVFAATLLAGIVLAINTAFAIVVSIKFPPTDGVGTIYEGDCSTVKRWNTGVHLILNMLGTALLAASNYTMQCLNAPTRSEVNAAHVRRVTLDIGQSSLRNLFYLGRRKGILWICLCLTSLPLHFFWNSTIFITLGTHTFSLIVADISFLQGAAYKTPPAAAQYHGYYSSTYDDEAVCDLSTLIPTSIFLEGYQEGRYTNMTAAQCLDTYTANLLTENKNLIVISNPHPNIAQDECSIYNGHDTQIWNDSSVFNMTANLATGTDWLGIEGSSTEVAGRLSQLRNQVKTTGTWQLGDYPVLYCLSETQGVSRCKLQYAMYIYVVVACNVVKVICMCMTLYHGSATNEAILATVGDAVASFIEVPDETTRGWCLLDHQDLRAGAWRQQKITQEYDRTYDRPSTTTLFAATNAARWCLTMLFCGTYVFVGIVLSSMYIAGTVESLGSAQTFQLKFGAMDTRSLLGLHESDSGGLLLDIVIANSWQVVLSVTYFLYNGLYTAQCAAMEWASYASERKSLRVTRPRGKQKSSYYLQLPYRYALPLTAMLALMHFLVAESIFLARVEDYNDTNGSQGKSLYDSSTMSFTDVGVSPVAAVTAICVGSLLMITQVIFVRRRIDNRMPIHGNRSVVISAMCHVKDNYSNQSETTTEGEDRATQLVMWGVTEKPKDVNVGSVNEYAGHCSFTNRLAELPECGRQYA